MTNENKPDSAALLPCPFCGGEITYDEADEPQHYFSCNNCLMRFSFYLGDNIFTEKAAIKKMNTRTQKAVDTDKLKRECWELIDDAKNGEHLVDLIIDHIASQNLLDGW